MENHAFDFARNGSDDDDDDDTNQHWEHYLTWKSNCELLLSFEMTVNFHKFANDLEWDWEMLSMAATMAIAVAHRVRLGAIGEANTEAEGKWLERIWEGRSEITVYHDYGREKGKGKNILN